MNVGPTAIALAMDLPEGCPETLAEEADAATSRRVLLPGSAMNRLPEVSKASAVGLKEELAEVAAEEPPAAFPLATATVVIAP